MRSWLAYMSPLNGCVIQFAHDNGKDIRAQSCCITVPIIFFANEHEPQRKGEPIIMTL